MSEDGNEADRILGEGWRPPSQLMWERAWAEHPQKKLLDELQAERDERGEPTWAVHVLFEGDLAVYVFQPVRKDDPRPSVHIKAWHRKVLYRGDVEGRAIVAEYGEID